MLGSSALRTDNDANSSSWDGIWWHGIDSCKKLMWDAKASAKALRALVKGLADEHVTLGEAYKYTKEDARFTTTATQDTTLGMMWDSNLENYARQGEVHLGSGKFLNEFADAFTKWRREQSAAKRKVIADAEASIQKYKRAKQRKETAQRRYVATLEKCKRHIEKRDKFQTEALRLRVRETLRDVESTLKEFEAASGDLMRAYLEYRTDMKRHMRRFEDLWRKHCVRLKSAMTEVLKVEEAVMYQGKILVDDDHRELKKLDVDKDIDLFVTRNKDIMSNDQSVMCMRRNSSMVQMERNRLQIPEQRHPERLAAKRKGLSWRERLRRFAGYTKSSSSAKKEKTPPKADTAADAAATTSNDSETKSNLEKFKASRQSLKVEAAIAATASPRAVLAKHKYDKTKTAPDVLTPRASKVQEEVGDSEEEEEEEKVEVVPSDSDDEKEEEVYASADSDDSDKEDTLPPLRVQFDETKEEKKKNVRDSAAAAAIVASLTPRAPSKFAVALYPFDGRDNSELSFTVGAKIEIIDDRGEWWHGKLTSTGAAGEFPANYVQIIGDVPKTPGGSLREDVEGFSDSARTLVAVHDFESRDDTELTVRRGQFVRVKSSGLEEWVMALAEDGSVGLVPNNYLGHPNEAVAEEEDDDEGSSEYDEDDA